MAAKKGVKERSWGRFMAEVLGERSVPVRRRVREILYRKAMPKALTAEQQIVDTIARQVLAMRATVGSMIGDATKNAARAKTLDAFYRVMLARGGENGKAFESLTPDERAFVGKYMFVLQYAEGRLNIGAENRGEDMEVIRHNHLHPEGKRMTPEQFRESADRIAEALVDKLIKDEHLRPETAVIALAWRSALPLGAAFAKRGFRRFVHIGARRNEETLATELYHFSNHEKVGAEDTVVIPDPMLATGNTVVTTLTQMGINPDVNRVISASVISAPEGVFHLARRFPKMRFYTAALDTNLNDHGFIEPGLGDFGNEYFRDLDKVGMEKLVTLWKACNLLTWTDDIHALNERLGVFQSRSVEINAQAAE